MEILIWVVVGIIGGFLARLVVRGEGPGGLIGDLIVGVIGGFIGGYVFRYFGHSGVTGINFGSIIVAFVGAVLLLLALRLITGRRTS